jgi:hypothetical protein
MISILPTLGRNVSWRLWEERLWKRKREITYRQHLETKRIIIAGW